MTRILHTEWSDGWGGQERRVLAEMVGMQARGHTLVLATRPTAQLFERARAAGITVVSVPFKGKFHLPSIVALVRLIRREGIEIVSTHSGIDSWVGALAARLAGVKLVRTRHLNLPLKRSWHNFVHDLAECIVSCGETMRGELIARDGFPPERVVSIPTGIDFEAHAPRTPREATREALGIPAGDFVVLMVGVIRGVKRHEVALRAFERFAATRADAWLVLAGEGPMRPDMEQLAQTLGMAARVKFLGHRDDVPDLLAAADCVLLTSRSEGVPQAVTQALGAGLAVVATRVGGVPELVIDGVTGLLREAEDVAGLAQALGQLAAQPALREQLGGAGRAHVRGHYSLAAMLDATETLYQKLLTP